ncbi:MAG TPA: hypothetical protein VNN78_01925 [Burkholderiales bacterium]|nr:hypothetical protein [Burkholderiales bacterium]
MIIFRLRVQTDYIQTTNVREPYHPARILARYDAEQLLLIEGLKGLAGKNGRAGGVCRPAFHRDMRRTAKLPVACAANPG